MPQDSKQGLSRFCEPRGASSVIKVWCAFVGVRPNVWRRAFAPRSEKYFAPALIGGRLAAARGVLCTRRSLGEPTLRRWWTFLLFLAYQLIVSSAYQGCHSFPPPKLGADLAHAIAQDCLLLTPVCAAQARHSDARHCAAIIAGSAASGGSKPEAWKTTRQLHGEDSRVLTSQPKDRPIPRPLRRPTPFREAVPARWVL